MTAKQIQTRIGDDGVLNISVPFGPSEANEEVVVTIQPAEDASAASVTDSLPFWSSRSLEDLAEQQGVQPFSDLNEISELWPMDDDPDALLRHIVTERQERRHAAEEGSAG